MWRTVVLLLLVWPRLATAAHHLESSGRPAPQSTEETPWDIGVMLSLYLFQSGTDYLQPVVTVDHGVLHLEARYNYEAQHTASAWVGWNFAWGEKLKLDLTPMLGGVFGDVNGFAPGLTWTLSWWLLELYSQTEFVVNLTDSSKSDFYAWSELSGRPVDWFRAGIALQRTRAFDSPRKLQWGPLIGVFVWKLVASGYWFNPGQTDVQYWVVTVGVNL
jgi:hypothetical protein